jgi:excisionase family DNA binding protein
MTYRVQQFIYSVSDLAELLQVSTRTVRNLINRGRFPNAYRIDPLSVKSSYRIPSKDVNAYIELQASSPLKES